MRYAERVAALMMAFVIVGVIVYRGSRGDLPSEFRGIRYANRDATNELAQKTSGATDVLAGSVDDIDGRLRALETPMYRLPHRQSWHQISGYDRLEQAGGGSDNALRVVDEGTAGGEAHERMRTAAALSRPDMVHPAILPGASRRFASCSSSRKTVGGTP
ncbi:MAG TPA: hypothetical protein VNV42_10560 [Solirubrobacteraceae bacterium]|nr:hypothetical protein [Solirubrobacteraceae bacterium]